jgi:hypothetical protein
MAERHQPAADTLLADIDALRAEIERATDWPVVIDGDGSRWIDYDWVTTRLRQLASPPTSSSPEATSRR